MVLSKLYPWPALAGTCLHSWSGLSVLGLCIHNTLPSPTVKVTYICFLLMFGLFLFSCHRSNLKPSYYYMSLSFDLSRSPDLLHLKVGFPLFSSLLRCWRILGWTVTSSQDVSVATVPPFPNAVEALMILSGGRSITCNRGLSVVTLQVQSLMYIIFIFSCVCALLCPLNIPYWNWRFSCLWFLYHILAAKLIKLLAVSVSLSDW